MRTRNRLLCVFLLFFSGGGFAADVQLRNDHTELVIDTTTARIISWTACLAPCLTLNNPKYRQEFVTSDYPFELVPGQLRARSWRVASRSGSSLVIESSPSAASSSSTARISVQVGRRHEVRMSLQTDILADGTSAFELSAPATLARQPAPGFAGSLSFVAAVTCCDNGHPATRFLDSGSANVRLFRQ